MSGFIWVTPYLGLLSIVPLHAYLAVFSTILPDTFAPREAGIKVAPSVGTTDWVKPRGGVSDDAWATSGITLGREILSDLRPSARSIRLTDAGKWLIGAI